MNPCLICGGSLVGDVVAHLLEMWWLIGLRYGESVFDMWWLIGWGCGGTFVGDVVAHWFEIW